MHWRIKGLLQKVLGVLPYGDALHYRLQRRHGGMRDFEREFLLKIEDWAGMASQLREAGCEIPESRLIEIGTGWYPTLPFACYLAGAQRVHTFDLNRLLKPDLLRLCIWHLGGQLQRIAEVSDVPIADVESRYARLLAHQEVDDLEMMTHGVVRYHAPMDMAASPLTDGSVDAIFSNSVLEHVTPEALKSIYHASNRLLKPQGWMFHSVNCGDHYSYADPKIHQLHYLQYTDREWAFWNNAFLYQNRLRAHQFVDAARDAGFEIVRDTSHARPQRLEQLKAMTVAPEFTHISPEKLCITTVDFIGRPVAT